MPDFNYTSAADALFGLQGMGIDTNNIEELKNPQGLIKESKYIISNNYNDINIFDIVQSEGIYTVSPGILKKIKAGQNIVINSNDNYIEINAVSGHAELDGLGNIQNNLPSGLTLNQILGDIPNNNYNSTTHTFVQKIKDLQTITQDHASSKADKTSVTTINNTLPTLLSESVYNEFLSKFGDTSGFLASNTIIDKLNNRASQSNLNDVIINVTNLQTDKAEKQNLENLSNQLGNLIVPPGGIAFNSNRSFISSFGDMSIFDHATTFISLLGDLTFIKNNSNYSSLIDYIQQIDNNFTSDLLNYKQDIIGDISNINNISIGYTLSDLIGNPNKANYVSTGALSEHQIIDFNTDTFYANGDLSNNIDNKLTISNMLIKIGKIFNNLKNDSTFADILGDFNDPNNVNSALNRNEFVTISQSLSFLHYAVDQLGVIHNPMTLPIGRTLGDVLGDFEGMPDGGFSKTAKMNTVAQKIYNIEQYIEKNIGITNDIHENYDSINLTGRASLIDIIGNVENYAYNKESNPFNSDKYYPLYSKNNDDDLYNAYNKCLNFINTKKTTIDNILNDINILTTEQISNLNNIKDNIKVGIIYNNNYSLIEEINDTTTEISVYIEDTDTSGPLIEYEINPLGYSALQILDNNNNNIVSIIIKKLKNYKFKQSLLTNLYHPIGIATNNTSPFTSYINNNEIVYYIKENNNLLSFTDPIQYKNKFQNIIIDESSLANADPYIMINIENYTITTQLYIYDQVNTNMTSISMNITDNELFGHKSVIFKDSTDNNIITPGAPLKLIKNKTYKFDQADSSNRPFPLAFSIKEGGTHNINNETFNFNTKGSGLIIEGLTIDNNIINPDLIFFDSMTYIIDSTTLILAGLELNYTMDKIRIYTDINLENEYVNATSQNEYNNNYTNSSIQFITPNNITNDTVYYYGIHHINKIYVGKITLKTRFYTNGVSYIINGITYSAEEYALNIGTDSNRYILLDVSDSTADNLYYFCTNNPTYTNLYGYECNTSSGLLYKVNRQPDTSLGENLESSIITEFTNNNIVLNKWNDNKNHLYFIPYLTNLTNIDETTEYKSEEEKYTDSSGDVYRLNLEIYYKSKEFNIISDINSLTNKLDNIYTSADSNLSNLLSIGNISNFYNNINRTLIDTLGSNPNDIFTSTGTLITYLQKISTQSNLESNLPVNNSLFDILGNLSTWNLTNYDTISSILTYTGKLNIGSNSLHNIYGDISIWNSTNHESIGSILNKTGVLITGSNTISSFIGDITNWNLTNNDNIYNISNKIGILNVGNNKLTNIIGNYSNIDLNLHDGLNEISTKIGKLNLTNSNNLSVIMGNMDEWNNTTNDTIIDILNKFNKINIGSNKLNDILGNIDENNWNTSTNETLSSLFSKMGKLNIGTNTLQDILGDISNTNWQGNNNDNLGEVLNKLGILSLGNNKLDNILGNLDHNTWNETNNFNLSELFHFMGRTDNGTNSLVDILGNNNNSNWHSDTHDTLNSLLTKTGKINIGSNKLSTIFDNLSTWNVNNNDTLSDIMTKMGKINTGSNKIQNIFDDLSTWNTTSNDTLSSIFNKTGKINIGTNTLQNIFDDLSTWNSTDNDTLAVLFNKIGKINIGSVPYDYTIGEILGDFDYWTPLSIKYDTIANVIKNIGIIQINNDKTFSDILGNFDTSNGGVVFNDNIASIISKIGLSSIISNYLPSNKTDIISLIGDSSSSFSTDTFASRLIRLGTTDELSSNLPLSNSLISVLGDFYINNAYSSVNTVTKRFEYLIGNSNTSLDLLNSYLPKVINSDIIDRSFIELIGNFNDVNNGYINTNKTLIETVNTIETIIGNSNITNNNTISDNINTLNSAQSNIISTLGNDLNTKIPADIVDGNDFTDFSKLLGDMSNVNNTIANRLYVLENNKLDNRIFGAFAIEGYYPLYISEIEALSQDGVTSIIKLPSVEYGPYKYDPITNTYDQNSPQWNDLPASLSNLELYLPLSNDFQQFIPSTGISYKFNELSVNNVTTLPQPQVIENILLNIKNINNILGDNISSYLGSSNLNLNNIANILGNMSSSTTTINDRINIIENNNNILGSISSSLNTNLPDIASVIGSNSSTTFSINQRLFNIEYLLGTNNDGTIISRLPNIFNNLNLILGDMIDVSAPINDRLIILETTNNYIGNIANKIPINNPSFDTVAKIIGNMTSVSKNIHTRLTDLENMSVDKLGNLSLVIPDDSNIPINSVSDLLGDMRLESSSVQTRINNLEDNIDAKIGSLSNILPGGDYNTLSKLIGSTTVNDTIHNRLKNNENYVGILTNVFNSNSIFNSLELILGNMTNETSSVQQRLNILENVSEIKIGDLSDILPVNPPVDTLVELIGDMKNITFPGDGSKSIHGRLITLETFNNSIIGNIDLPVINNSLSLLIGDMTNESSSIQSRFINIENVLDFANINLPTNFNTIGKIIGDMSSNVNDSIHNRIKYFETNIGDIDLKLSSVNNTLSKMLGNMNNSSISIHDRIMSLENSFDISNLNLPNDIQVINGINVDLTTLGKILGSSISNSTSTISDRLITLENFTNNNIGSVNLGTYNNLQSIIGNAFENSIPIHNRIFNIEVSLGSNLDLYFISNTSSLKDTLGNMAGKNSIDSRLNNLEIFNNNNIGTLNVGSGDFSSLSGILGSWVGYNSSIIDRLLDYDSFKSNTLGSMLLPSSSNIDNSNINKIGSLIGDMTEASSSISNRLINLENFNNTKIGTLELPISGLNDIGKILGNMSSNVNNSIHDRLINIENNIDDLILPPASITDPNGLIIDLSTIGKILGDMSSNVNETIQSRLIRYENSIGKNFAAFIPTSIVNGIDLTDFTKLLGNMSNVNLSIHDRLTSSESNIGDLQLPVNTNLNNISKIIGNMTSNVNGSIQDRLSDFEIFKNSTISSLNIGSFPSLSTAIGSFDSNQNISINDRLIDYESFKSDVLGSLFLPTNSNFNTIGSLIGPMTNESFSIQTRINNLELYPSLIGDVSLLTSYLNSSGSLTSITSIIGDMSYVSKNISQRLDILLSHDNSSGYVKTLNDTQLKIGDLYSSCLPSTGSLTTLSNMIGDMSNKSFSINKRIQDIENGLVAGVTWKASFDNKSDLDNLVEADITVGWAYYIKNENDAYIIIDEIDGDYKPTNWFSKSFIKIADYTELSNLVLSETTRASNVENILTSRLNNLLSDDLSSGFVKIITDRLDVLLSSDLSSGKVNVLETNLNNILNNISFNTFDGLLKSFQDDISTNLTNISSNLAAISLNSSNISSLDSFNNNTIGSLNIGTFNSLSSALGAFDVNEAVSINDRISNSINIIDSTNLLFPINTNPRNLQSIGLILGDMQLEDKTIQERINYFENSIGIDLHSNIPPTGTLSSLSSLLGSFNNSSKSISNRLNDLLTDDESAGKVKIITDRLDVLLSSDLSSGKVNVLETNFNNILNNISSNTFDGLLKSFQDDISTNLTNISSNLAAISLNSSNITSLDSFKNNTIGTLNIGNFNSLSSFIGTININNSNENLSINNRLIAFEDFKYVTLGSLFLPTNSSFNTIGSLIGDMTNESSSIQTRIVNIENDIDIISISSYFPGIVNGVNYNTLKTTLGDMTGKLPINTRLNVIEDFNDLIGDISSLIPLTNSNTINSLTKLIGIDIKSNASSSIHDRISLLENISLNLIGDISSITTGKLIDLIGDMNNLAPIQSRLNSLENNTGISTFGVFTSVSAVIGDLSDITDVSNTVAKRLKDMENSLNSNVTSINTSLNNEITRATNTEGTLSNLYTSNKTSIVNAINDNFNNNIIEKNRAENIENTLISRVDNIFKIDGNTSSGLVNNLNTNVSTLLNDVSILNNTQSIIGSFSLPSNKTLSSIFGSFNINDSDINTIINDTILITLKNLYINNNKLGSLSDILPVNGQFNNLSNMIGDMSSGITNSIQSRLSDIEIFKNSTISSLNIGLFSSLSAAIGSFNSNQNISINDRLIDYESFKSDVLGSLLLPTNSNFNTIGSLIGPMNNESSSIQTRINNLELFPSLIGDVSLLTSYLPSSGSITSIIGDMSYVSKNISQRLDILLSHDNSTGYVKTLNDTQLKIGDLSSSCLPSTGSLTTLSNMIGDMSNKSFSINKRIQDIENGLVAGVTWKASFDNKSDLDSLPEADISVGWAYYIKNENDAYIIVDDINGDYKPNSWVLKSFIKIADYTELSNLVSSETTRAIAAEAINAASISTEKNRAEAVEATNAAAISTEQNRAEAVEATNTTAIANNKIITDKIGSLQLNANDTLGNALGDLTSDSININNRIQSIEQKVGIKDSSSADFSSDVGLKLPINNSLATVLAGNSDMLDFNPDFVNNNGEPIAPENPDTAKHDDLMTIMRKIGRLSCGSLNNISGTKYYNNNLAEVFGDMNNYNSSDGSIIFRLLAAETLLNSVFNSVTDLQSELPQTFLHLFLDYYFSINDDGSFYKGGILGSQIDDTNNLVSSSTKISWSENNNINRTINTNSISVPDYFNTFNNVTWLNGNSNQKSQIIISNINTSNYIDSGFTIAFYLKDFQLNNSNIDSINNLVTMIIPAKERLNKNRFTHVKTTWLQNEYQLYCNEFNLYDNNDGGNIISSPPEPRFNHNNSNHFLFPDTNSIKNNPNEVMLVVLTFHSDSSDATNTASHQVWYDRNIDLAPNATISSTSTITNNVISTYSDKWGNGDVNSSQQNISIVGDYPEGTDTTLNRSLRWEPVMGGGAISNYFILEMEGLDINNFNYFNINNNILQKINIQPSHWGLKSDFYNNSIALSGNWTWQCTFKKTGTPGASMNFYIDIPTTTGQQSASGSKFNFSLSTNNDFTGLPVACTQYIAQSGSGPSWGLNDVRHIQIIHTFSKTIRVIWYNEDYTINWDFETNDAIEIDDFNSNSIPIRVYINNGTFDFYNIYFNDNEVYFNSIHSNSNNNITTIPHSLLTSTPLTPPVIDPEYMTFDQNNILHGNSASGLEGNPYSWNNSDDKYYSIINNTLTLISDNNNGNSTDWGFSAATYNDEIDFSEPWVISFSFTKLSNGYGDTQNFYIDIPASGNAASAKYAVELRSGEAKYWINGENRRTLDDPLWGTTSEEKIVAMNNEGSQWQQNVINHIQIIYTQEKKIRLRWLNSNFHILRDIEINEIVNLSSFSNDRIPFLIYVNDGLYKWFNFKYAKYDLQSNIFNEIDNNKIGQNLNRLFENYSWFVFGGNNNSLSSSIPDSNRNYFNLNDYQNNNIEKFDANASLESANSSISEIMIFKKVLIPSEITELSKLLPKDIKTTFKT